MARNYKRDTRGRFARVAGQKARGSSPARGRLSSSGGVRKAPIPRPTRGRAAVQQRNALRTARTAASREQAFWNKQLGKGVVKVTAGTSRVGLIRKKTIPSIRVSPTSNTNALKMQKWNDNQLKKYR